MRFKFLFKAVSGVLALCLMCQNFVYANTGSTLFSDSARELILSKAYEVNDKNKICTIKNAGEVEHQYFYDVDGRLSSENDLIKKESIDYTYDAKGNITRKEICDYSDLSGSKQVFKCDYDKDNKIISYNGNKILYDKFGNISKYKNNLNFEWKNGKICRIYGPNINIEYSYDSNNKRISKSVNGLVTKFCFTEQKICQSIGDKVLEWYVPSENIFKNFNYDGKDYTYICDLQRNVVAIADESGKLVANYTYDTWGKVINITDENGNDVSNDSMHIGNINPLRYRGYYYDSETGFYYLNSRYYDPETGRFLSADNEEYLKSNNIDIPENLYMYCMNDPINMSDYDGYCPIAASVTLTALGSIPELALPVAAVLAVTAVASLTNPKIQKIVNDAVTWAISTYTTSAARILERFRQLTQKICKCIGELVHKYILYKVRCGIPSSLKTPDGRVDLSKFKSRGGPMPPKGPRGFLGPGGYIIVKDLDKHGEKAWKLFDRTLRRLASLAADGRILGR